MVWETLPFYARPAQGFNLIGLKIDPHCKHLRAHRGRKAKICTVIRKSKRACKSLQQEIFSVVLPPLHVTPGKLFLLMHLCFRSMDWINFAVSVYCLSIAERDRIRV